MFCWFLLFFDCFLKINYLMYFWFSVFSVAVDKGKDSKRKRYDALVRWVLGLCVSSLFVCVCVCVCVWICCHPCVIYTYISTHIQTQTHTPWCLINDTGGKESDWASGCLPGQGTTGSSSCWCQQRSPHVSPILFCVWMYVCMYVLSCLYVCLVCVYVLFLCMSCLYVRLACMCLVCLYSVTCSCVTMWLNMWLNIAHCVVHVHVRVGSTSSLSHMFHKTTSTPFESCMVGRSTIHRLLRSMRKPRYVSHMSTYTLYHTHTHTHTRTHIYTHIHTNTHNTAFWNVQGKGKLVPILFFVNHVNENFPEVIIKQCLRM